MASPTVTFELPDTSLRRVGPEAIVGRGASAQVRVDDARVSTIHAELSWRAEGFVLIARGGRLVVEGRGVREVNLSPGVAVSLSPAIVLCVHSIETGEAPVVSPTAGRDRLHFRVGHEVTIAEICADGPPLRVTGCGARILRVLLDQRGLGMPWDEVAEAVWPEDGALRSRLRDGGRVENGWIHEDERRFRNRWDQQIVALRKALVPIRCGAFLHVRLGIVGLAVRPDDIIDGA